ncbi:RNA polymerase sigma-70 factor (ECF subfamily) [Rathayibacter sp. PhB93]|uniref:RNA polymerase sigma factor n=1 Tax=unclassified Rathayibacter TaxID=2609250 RepID=UPI000F45FC01|nr:MULTISPECIES: RNA polymerase sigma factor [unclassified Rathayibacter]ROQ05615.1 RNA polymerase sigma-70 factor (ECF subfamily) [Rathayibacter sp. PhB93]TDQ12314.1 RNA polymerase sigma-70 factor (ECF subfamily) [Rathayibacter sp. PhB1]
MEKIDRVVFEELFAANFTDLIRFVRRRAPEHLVDDVVAETFLVAWRRRRDLPAHPRPWLFATASNVLRNARRRETREQLIAERVWLPEAVAADSSTEIDALNALRSLSEADQEVLSLHVWEDLSDTEAAKVLGCSRAAFSMRLSRAKKRYAAILDPTRPRAQLTALPTEGFS